MQLMMYRNPLLLHRYNKMLDHNDDDDDQKNEMESIHYDDDDPARVR
jgi:hypothetical protein